MRIVYFHEKNFGLINTPDKRYLFFEKKITENFICMEHVMQDSDYYHENRSFNFLKIRLL